ncbi:MAG: HTH-type transcriptional activator RhaR [Chroococcidiopsis sp. SAG 2025]|uniref:AraC family transcriptional regulator n=1 Tax=Chroococcidiopsis sp. SAG 2025 TaxID=171389 RepID=UPI002936EBC2|nr:AraC family transcriptional regulator [Chroococcidiopsis sp. SAG 2025]MDV2996929.1 HTH-type transcriptional activator RhaR [Chroococcidiopsis sp. SAG 2025]
MAANKTIAVNFSQSAATSQVLSQPNLFSSHQADWNGIYLEYHNSPLHETPEHYPTQHVVAIQTKGVVEAERKLAARFKQEQIRAGDVCVVPAYTRHWIHSKGEQGLILLSLEPSFLTRSVPNSIDANDIELLPHFAQTDPLIHQIGLSLKTALQTDSAGSRFYAEALGVALVAHLLQFYTTQKYKIQDTTESIEDVRIKQAKEYIHAHLVEELSLEAIATTVGMSQYHFSRIFKQVTGVTLWQYVVQQRVELAKRLLAQPGQSIVEVSNHLGFSSQGQFTNFFRKHTGITPTQYKQKL